MTTYIQASHRLTELDAELRQAEADRLTAIERARDAARQPVAAAQPKPKPKAKPKPKPLNIDFDNETQPVFRGQERPPQGSAQAAPVTPPAPSAPAKPDLPPGAVILSAAEMAAVQKLIKTTPRPGASADDHCKGDPMSANHGQTYAQGTAPTKRQGGELTAEEIERVRAGVPDDPIRLQEGWLACRTCGVAVHVQVRDDQNDDQDDEVIHLTSGGRAVEGTAAMTQAVANQRSIDLSFALCPACRHTAELAERLIPAPGA